MKPISLFKHKKKTIYDQFQSIFVLDGAIAVQQQWKQRWNRLIHSIKVKYIQIATTNLKV